MANLRSREMGVETSFPLKGEEFLVEEIHFFLNFKFFNPILYLG